MSSSNGLQTIDSVLIVDDSRVQRGIGAALCRELRIDKVHEAGDGREALALLDRLPAQPALFIIDLEMPTMDGPELLSALGGRATRAPIILASSRERALMNSVQDMGVALGLRIVGALQKPLTLAGLGALLQNKLHAEIENHPAKRQAVDPESLRAALLRGDIFSSMQQLARIPFTELKIDRTFVHGAHERDSLQVILRSALEMASQLGIETVAEGVESLQDWRLLRQYGCKLAQGWLLAKAMPGEQLEGWLVTLQGRRPELQS